GPALDALTAALGQPLSSYQANYYDAVYLLAMALERQARVSPGRAFGGDGLRSALADVTGAGNKYDATEWAQAKKAIESGAVAHYTGISGPCEFDANGGAAGPLQIWKITYDVASSSGSAIVQQVIDPTTVP